MRSENKNYFYLSEYRFWNTAVLSAVVLLVCAAGCTVVRPLSPSPTPSGTASLPASLPPTPVSASASAAALAELDAADAKWKAQQITSYRIEVRVVSSIWHAQTHTVIVREGAATETTASCIPAPAESGKCTINDYDPASYTITGLFAKARQSLESQQAQWAAVTYDSTYGYPIQITFDNPDILDEDWSWRVLSFEILE